MRSSLGVVALLLAVNVRRPPTRPMPVAMVAFAAGWLLGELPLQAVVLELLQPGADLPVHRGDVVVGAGDRVAHRRGVGVERRQRHVGRIDDRLLSPRAREGAALVRDAEVEHGEERLIWVGPISPMSFIARLIPTPPVIARDVVIRLRIIRAIVAGVA